MFLLGRHRNRTAKQMTHVTAMISAVLVALFPMKTNKITIHLICSYGLSESDNYYVM